MPKIPPNPPVGENIVEISSHRTEKRDPRPGPGEGGTPPAKRQRPTTPRAANSPAANNPTARRLAHPNEPQDGDTPDSRDTTVLPGNRAIGDTGDPMQPLPTYPNRHPRGIGAPTKYSPALAKSICQQIATTTLTLRQICDETNCSLSQLMVWLQRHQEFAEWYAAAQEARTELRADEIIEIADNSSNDWVDYETKSGRLIRTFDYEHSRRSELRIKTRQWLMERYGRRRFAPNVEVRVADPLAALPVQNEAQRLADAMALMDRIRGRLQDAAASGEVSEADYVEVPPDAER